MQTKKTASFILFLALGACVSAEEVERARTQYQNDLRIAPASLSKEQQEICIASFKAGMHDPGSFELAGSFRLNSNITRISRSMAITAGLTYPSRLLVYTAPARGRNSFGGLVLNEIQCLFNIYSEGNLRFYEARQ